MVKLKPQQMPDLSYETLYDMGALSFMRWNRILFEITYESLWAKRKRSWKHANEWFNLLKELKKNLTGYFDSKRRDNLNDLFDSIGSFDLDQNKKIEDTILVLDDIQAILNKFLVDIGMYPRKTRIFSSEKKIRDRLLK